ncbi:acaloleptin A-like isoform X2 [Aethina tumida]|uniref:acaloleptin A-like isoform X1 n=1 Tax=Aethina tumida TaxID=116153 RepID=UPI002147A7E7|nr:acaloleptin A-like isoform X1 [Aethina tumida]XP_049820986.1 acaloleptin A-like isoform X2 [Aethina tumida]
MLKEAFFFAALAVIVVSAINAESLVDENENEFDGLNRLKRSPETEEEKRKRERGWHVSPDVGGDGKNVQGVLETKYVGEKHDFNAGWGKVFHGPGRAKPTWHVGGTFRFKRETEEEKRKRERGWHVSPDVGGDGKNVQGVLETKYVGEKHDFNAGWGKVFHGPGRAKPTWHVGGTFRFKRETEEEKRKREQGWQVKPDLSGDGKNTQAAVDTVYKGEKHDFNAGVSQIIHGPNRARPTWHVGGTFRW